MRLLSRLPFPGLIFFLFCSAPSLFAQAPPLVAKAEQSLDQGIAFFHSLANRGGYVYVYSLDGKQQWGEAPLHGEAIEVQPPGTPAVGMALLEAYRITGKPDHLAAARDAAYALIRGQNQWGGWGHTIRFVGKSPNHVSFDDDQSQSAIRFLMAMDAEISEDSISQAVQQALEMMLTSQLALGGWPHRYPQQNNYHDYATFNDGGIRDCIELMRIAVRQYDDPRFRASLDRAAQYLMRSQLPPPSAGWAQQYNEFLQPAWARTFEPPSVCPQVTIDNLQLLLDFAIETGDERYLEAVPDALRWLEAVRLPHGKWPRFVELYTNVPMYYDRGRIRVDSLAQLSDERRLGYGYEQNLSGKIEAFEARLQQYKAMGRDEYRIALTAPLSSAARQALLTELEAKVERILEEQDRNGRWITHQDRYKYRVAGELWDGSYRTQDRISSRVFIRNVEILTSYLRLLKEGQ